MDKFMLVVWVLIGILNLSNEKIHKGDYLLIWATLIMYLIKAIRG